MKFFKRFIFTFFVILFLAVTTVFVAIAFYKKEITAMLIHSLKTSYGLNLKTEEVNVSFFSNWPNASIQLKNISLINDACKGEPLLKACSVSLSFNIERLFKKEFIVKSIALKDAQINLVKNPDGIKNFEFKNKGTSLKSTSSIRFEISKILIKNTEFKFLNKQQQKKIEFTLIDNVVRLKNYEDGVETVFTGPVFVKGLLFREEKGPFLNNKLADLNLNSRICFRRKEIFIHQPSYITIGNQRYDVNAFINLNKDKQLALSIEAKNISFRAGIGLLNDGIKKGLSTIHIHKPLDVKALIIAKIGIQEEPIINLKVSSTNNDFTIGNSKIPYSNVNFYVSLISLDSTLQKGNAENAKVILKSLKGNVYGFPFMGSVLICNLIQPYIAIKANLVIDVKKIPFKPGKEFVLNGTANAAISYLGPVNKLNHRDFLDAPMNLTARVTFNNVSYREKHKPYTYLINGKALLNNKELTFNHLLLKMNGGTLSLKGSVDNFVKYALGYTNGFKAKLNAVTNYFDLTTYIVKKTDSLSHQHAQEKMQAVENESNFEFDVSLSANKLLLRKVEAENALIILNYKDKLLSLKSLNVNTCDGNLSATATIYDMHKIDAEIITKNINVNKLFIQFENFGQDAITSENLHGNISLNAKIKMDLGEKMEIIPKTMKGELKLQLKDGHLLNFEPLQKISDYIFKKRDFQDIAFSEINETFFVDGYKMQIEDMEIVSNVLNLYMSGTYHFKEQSNINMMLPWSNLKRRGKNYIQKSYGENAENSRGLKLNYSGFPHKHKLSLGNK